MNNMIILLAVVGLLTLVFTFSTPTIHGYLPLGKGMGAIWFHETEFILRYCLEHASDPNPVQDLVDKVIITWGWFDGETCATVKQVHDAYLRN